MSDMSKTIHATRESSAVPIDLFVTDGTAGLSVIVAIRQAGSSPASYLDFADSTFKTAGWTTRQASLADLGGGIYSLAGGLDLSAATALDSGTEYLLAEYEIGGSISGIASDLIDLAHTERLRDVYRIEGLDGANPLVVSPTKRRVPASGALIDQDVTTVASTVTVDRV